jgi:nicotinamidase/pyrazinamidase
MPIELGHGDALLIVDPQVDFCPGGALAVPAGDRIFDAVNRAARAAPLVVASRDWHPSGHVSFSQRGGPWPVHCEAGTAGAEFHPQLDASHVDMVVSKGTDADREAYSAFDGTDLAGWLRDRGVRRLFVAGLATDYCVRASVLDAREAGFDVVVLEDAVGAVDVKPGDGERALAEMKEAGARVASSGELAGVA